MIYLDNNATTRVLPEVLEAMLPYLREEYGNPSTGYPLGRRAKAAVDRAREQVAALIGAAPGEIVFTGCGTEADNTAIASALAAFPDRRHLVLSAVEHSAMVGFAKAVHPEVELTELPVDAGGRIDLDRFRAALRPDTALASVMWANNETGICQPVAEAAALAHEAGVLFHTDAVNAVGKVPVTIAGFDYLSLSGHKFHAPKGVGALFVREGAPFRPLLVGGGQEGGRRAGTEAVAQIVALGAAAEAAAVRLANDCQHETARLRDRLQAALSAALDGLHLNGDPAHRLPNTLHLSIDRVPAGDLLLLAAERGLAIASGSACSTGKREPSRIMKAMGHSDERALSSIRISLSSLNTEEEIDEAARTLIACIEKIRSLRPEGGPVVVAG